MARSELVAGIAGVLREERRYAKKLLERGDLGSAKLALAAIAEIEAGLREAANGDAATYSERLGEILRERRSDYLGLWNDDDGIGTSTFYRVMEMIAA